MSKTVNFALNHMAAPRKSHEQLFDLANELGIDSVEIRNDLAGNAIANGIAPSVVGQDASKRGLEILSINALQRFNDWSASRADEAKQLAAYARDCGAKTLVLCPVNDLQWQPATAERLAGLRRSLEGLAPILAAAGIKGLVEPLGFAECSLRLKAEAVAAIDTVGVASIFNVLHDTFHHYVAGEQQFYAARTGLVHISGVDDPKVSADVMRDPHRVLVDRHDCIDNVGQIRTLIAQGYAGPFSFEPFAGQVHALPDIAAALKASMNFIRSELNATD